MSNVATKQDLKDAVRLMTIRLGIGVAFLVVAVSLLVFLT